MPCIQALRNTRMLAAYARIDERVQLLGYAIKHMAKVFAMFAVENSISSVQLRISLVISKMLIINRSFHGSKLLSH